MEYLVELSYLDIISSHIPLSWKFFGRILSLGLPQESSLYQSKTKKKEEEEEEEEEIRKMRCDAMRSNPHFLFSSF